jgi:hypothetical protein
MIWKIAKLIIELLPIRCRHDLKYEYFVFPNNYNSKRTLRVISIDIGAIFIATAQWNE